MASYFKDPKPLSEVISKIITMRGLARNHGNVQLEEIWQEVAGERIGSQTKPTGVKKGVLQISVSNAAMLGELTSFHKPSLLETLKKDHADQKIEEIKFKLQSDIV